MFEIQWKAPASFKSHGWEYFGFPMKWCWRKGGGQNIDKDVGIVARKAWQPIWSDIIQEYQCPRQDPRGMLLKNHLSESDWAKAIRNSIEVFIAAYMKTYSIAQKKGFIHMLNVLESWYVIASRTHLSGKKRCLICINRKKKKILLLNCHMHLLLCSSQTDGTSRAMESQV